MYSIIYNILMALFIFVSLFMILLVLIQKGRGGGLSSAFTGAAGNTTFGSKTGDVLTWVTSITFGVFVLLAITMNLMVVLKPKNTVANNTPKVETPVQNIPATSPSTTLTTLPVEIPAATSQPATPAASPSTLPN